MQIILKVKIVFLKENIHPIIQPCHSKHGVWVGMKSQFSKKYRCMVIESCRQSDGQNLESIKVKDSGGYLHPKRHTGHCSETQTESEPRQRSGQGGQVWFTSQYWEVKGVEETTDRRWIQVCGYLLSFSCQAQEMGKEQNSDSENRRSTFSFVTGKLVS